MSQHDLTIDNASRTTVRLDIQSGLQALGTCMKGSSAPSTPYAGMLWLDDDTPSSTVWTLKRYDGTDWIPVSYIDTVANTEVPVSGVTVAGAVGFLSGWLWSNNGSDAAHDIDIAAGRGVDTTGAALIQGGAMTKRYDAAWAAGNGNGGRSGSAADGGWWIHAILDVDDALVDYIFSQSRTAPTLPSGYTLFVPIGWFYVVSGSIVAFHTSELSGGGVELLWDTPTLEVNSTLGTTRREDAVKVPSGISVLAIVTVSLYDASVNILARVCSPYETDAAPSETAAPLANLNSHSGSRAAEQKQLRVRTNTDREIAARATGSLGLYAVQTDGFEWSRR